MSKSREPCPPPVTHPQALALDKVRFGLDRVRVVVGDEASVAAQAEGGDGLLVDGLLCAAARQSLVVKGAVVAAGASVLVARSSRAQEAAPVQGGFPGGSSC